MAVFSRFFLHEAHKMDLSSSYTHVHMRVHANTHTNVPIIYNCVEILPFMMLGLLIIYADHLCDIL